MSPSPTRNALPRLLQALLAATRLAAAPLTAVSLSFLPIVPAAAQSAPAPPAGSAAAPSGAAALAGPDDPLAIGFGASGWPPAGPVQAPAAPPASPPVVVPTEAPPPPPAPTLTPTTEAPPPQRQIVLDRSRRLLQVLENGRELRSFPVAVGMPGWETPVGRFEVLEMTANPIWEHPATGKRFPPGPDNPLGSRWIGFHRDCRGRSGFNGKEYLKVNGCVTAGFHGTPNRDSVGRAVSHGCVRLFDEHARELFDLVSLGTPVMVLP